ncbi:hypothetical protein F4811DRAFT_504941 [Daldinia bambusicola]|nr:hypothetical protein F4811DRAFT_504941 [Daldinia bambusicola]
MVVRTPSLNSLKNILPTIHHPLLLTPRESQSLLSSITKSFRKNLDKEHPWGHPEDIPPWEKFKEKKLASAKSASSSPSSSSLDNNNTLGQQRPTDRHLRAILSNPLFSHQVQQDKQKPPSVPRDPFDVFDYAVSRGLMTPRRAAGFLIKVRSQIQSKSDDDIRRAMAESQAGLRVVQWLRASGLETSQQFLSNPSLFTALIPFMYAEGLEEVAWAWVARMAVGEEADDEEKHRMYALSSLLAAILRQVSTTYSGAKASLDKPYEAIIRTNDILPKDNDIAFKCLRYTWARMSWSSTVFASEWPKPSAPLFDSYVDIGRPLNVHMDLAHLGLHHPLAPDHSAAVQFLHSTSSSKDLSPSQRRRVLCMALDTADRLKEIGDSDELSWVEHFLLKMMNELNLDIFNAAEKDLIASTVPIYRMI